MKDDRGVPTLLVATTLFAANFLFVRLTFRSRRASRLLDGTPTVLLEHGLPHAQALRSEAITVEELHAAALERGFDRLADVDLIVLEPNGHLAVMGREAAGAWRARQADGPPARA